MAPTQSTLKGWNIKAEGNLADPVRRFKPRQVQAGLHSVQTMTAGFFDPERVGSRSVLGKDEPQPLPNRCAVHCRLYLRW